MGRDVQNLNDLVGEVQKFIGAQLLRGDKIQKLILHPSELIQRIE